MKIEVKDNGEKLNIKMVETKTNIIVPYDEEKSYIKNILNFFPKFGVVDYIQGKNKDILELKELK